MSDISVEDEIDCSNFVQNDDTPKKQLISENSVKCVRICENKGSKVLKEKATIFTKVQTIRNQATFGLNKNETS